MTAHADRRTRSDSEPGFPTAALSVGIMPCADGFLRGLCSDALIYYDIYDTDILVIYRAAGRTGRGPDPPGREWC